MLDNFKNSDLKIHWSRDDELAWVNNQYRKIDFKPSRLNIDKTAIAICNGEHSGLSRLCFIEDTVFELGGMYVSPKYRGLGIARQLVRFLIKSRNRGDRLFCLPFAHLQNFYVGEGFEKVPENSLNAVPLEVLEKYRWCNETYPHEVLLLKLDIR